MRLAASLLLAFSLVGCGSKVVFEESGAGGSGSTSTTGSKSTGAPQSGSVVATADVVSSSTGSDFCDAHEQCAPNVCNFATGQCVPACNANTCDSCGPGSFCEPCAFGSCPACGDCVAACMPTLGSRCDDDDPCPPGSGVCYQPDGVCLQACGPNGDCGGFAFCDFCATGSCCGCDDCVSVCIGGE